jgi:NADH pyrophosphatase NudC (nudix superfamily)
MNEIEKPWRKKIMERLEALEKYCNGCGVHYTARRVDQKYCCNQCKRKFYQRELENVD